MSELSMFFAENVEKRENKFVEVSKRFKDASGKPIKWEIKPITGEEDEKIRKECTKRVPIPGKKNQYTQDFDSNVYIAKLATVAIVYPNLNDKALQDSYKAMGAEQLIKKMLYEDEFARLAEVLTVNGEDINEAIEEAKN